MGGACWAPTACDCAPVSEAVGGPEDASGCTAWGNTVAAVGDGSTPLGRIPGAEVEGDGSAADSCQGAVSVVVAVVAVDAGRVGSGTVVELDGAAARPPRRPGVSGGHTTSESGSPVVARPDASGSAVVV